MSPSPLGARFGQLNRERRYLGLAVAVIGDRIAEPPHLLSEGD